MYVRIIVSKATMMLSTPKTVSLGYAEQEDASVYNEDYDISEMIIVVTYNTMRYALDTHLKVLKDIKEDTEAKKEMEEAEEEITPLTFSNPQKDLVYSYFADATLREMWSTNKIDKVKFFKALLCHRKLGYTYNHVNRIGHVYC